MPRVDVVEEMQLLDSYFYGFNSKISSALNVFGPMTMRQGFFSGNWHFHELIIRFMLFIPIFYPE